MLASALEQPLATWSFRTNGDQLDGSLDSQLAASFATS
jgi:hypothetical protein